MTHPMTAFLVASGFTSAVCYLLITRAQNRRAQGMLVSRPVRRASSGDNSAADGGSCSPDSAGWGWFGHSDGSSHTTDSCSTAGGGDGGSSGDCGGGGGGGD